MKKLIFILTILLNSISFGQKAQFSIFLSGENAGSSAMKNYGSYLPFGLAYGFKPSFNLPMLVQFKYMIGSYARFNETEYLLVNNQTTKFNFTYKSKNIKWMVGTKWCIGDEFRTIRGFVTPEVGFINLKTFNTYDYTYNNHSYSERHVDLKDLFFAYGGEAGFEINFKDKNSLNSKHRIAIGVNAYFGPDVKYTNISTRQLTPGGYTAHDYVELINKNIGSKYITPINYAKYFTWGIQIGYIFNFEERYN